MGEISDALEDVWDRHTPQNNVVQGAYSSVFNSTADEKIEVEYKQALQKINTFAEEEGRRPRILVAKMGQDGHDRGAKVIASGFSDI